MLQSALKRAGNQSADISSEVISLVASAKEGYENAFEQLFALYEEKIFRMVYYRTQSRMEAEDLTQEIFMKAYKNLSRLKNVERFQSWLFTIALNRVRDFHRKNLLNYLFSRPLGEDATVPPDPVIHDQAEPLTNLMKQDFWKQINLMLDKLSRMEREVFMLRFMDLLTIKEISRALKKNESTVKTHLYRALSKFKKESGLLRLLQEKTE